MEGWGLGNMRAEPEMRFEGARKCLPQSAPPFSLAPTLPPSLSLRRLSSHRSGVLRGCRNDARTCPFPFSLCKALGQGSSLRRPHLKAKCRRGRAWGGSNPFGQFAAAQGDGTRSSLFCTTDRRSETNFSTKLPGFKSQSCFLLSDFASPCLSFLI